FPSAYLLSFLLLARLPEGAWVRPDVLEAWLLEHHPFWKGESLRPSRQQPWLGTFLLGVAYHLRAVQAARDGDEWLVRLAPTGRRRCSTRCAPGRTSATASRSTRRRRCWSSPAPPTWTRRWRAACRGRGWPTTWPWWPTRPASTSATTA